LAILGFLGFAVSYGMRVNLSMAIVAMTATNDSTTSTNLTSSVCPTLLSESGLHHTSRHDTAPTESAGEFDWNGEDQGIILGSFFWGYIVLQVPGGMLSERIGKTFFLHFHFTRHISAPFLQFWRNALILQIFTDQIISFFFSAGGKWPFGIGMLVTAIFSLLIPVAARSGKGYLIACRIIQGLGEVRENLWLFHSMIKMK